MTDYDAVIVGASVAGSATATLLARAGARVALLEKSPNPQHFKSLCTHEMAAVGREPLERLGLIDELETINGEHGGLELWSQYGWIRPGQGSDTPSEGINLRRETLDPRLRQQASETDGVDLRLGATVIDVLRGREGRPAGVRVRVAGGEEEIRGRVVIGADGRSSSVAKLTGTRARVKPHGRFGYFAYYENLPLTSGRAPQFWFLEPDHAYAFPTDAGLTLMALAPRKTPETLAAFKADLEGEFERRVRALPDGPDFSAARRVDKFKGALDTPNLRRPASAPGLAFVGDAAQVSDFVWGTGCGFALAGATMLADAIGPLLASHASDEVVDRGLVAYRREQRRRQAPHHMMISEYSTARPLSPVERLLFKTGPHDQRVALAMQRLAGRIESPPAVLTPALVLHALRVRARLGARGGAATSTASSEARAPRPTALA